MERIKDVVYALNCIPKKSSRRLIQLTDENLGHLGLKAHHTIVIAIIGDDPGTSQRHIMENTPFNKARVSIIVSELIDRGYVVDKSTGKTAALYLTGSGEKVYEIAGSIFMKHHSDMLSSLSDEEVRTLHRILLKMDITLDEMLRTK